MAIDSKDKAATKFKIRNIALRDELGNNLYNVERSLDENRDKKRHERRKLKIKSGQMKKERAGRFGGRPKASYI